MSFIHKNYLTIDEKRLFLAQVQRDFDGKDDK